MMSISQKTLDKLSRKVGKKFRGKFKIQSFRDIIKERKAERVVKQTKPIEVPKADPMVNPTPRVETIVEEPTATQVILNGQPV